MTTFENPVPDGVRMIETSIQKLIRYGLDCGFLQAEDVVYAQNRLLETLRLDDFSAQPFETTEIVRLEDLLRTLTDYAFQNGLIKSNGVASRDLFDTKLMGCLMPPPSVVIREFMSRYQCAPRQATDYFYQFSMDVNYIRRNRIEKDIRWKSASQYGEVHITINLSKPEKDPADIIAAAAAAPTSYPKCLLCREMEGYAGHLNRPARQNHRLIPIRLDGETWYFQYSPYVYYDEHCIALNERHIPMKIDRSTFRKLRDFLNLFPHYFIGSNADLPIVGGSILSHDHFQGGCYHFPMALAQVRQNFRFDGYPLTTAGIVNWPLSTIRLRSRDSEQLIGLAGHILDKWRCYTDERISLFAETDGVLHNTITPIMRMSEGLYELDLVLRNNITTEAHPLGLFHPHAALHHIKKENIGLIEVMGLAVLPPRLKCEIEALKIAMLQGENLRADPALAHHADWVYGFLPRYPDMGEDSIDEILRDEIGAVFVRVLEDAGVFKQTAEGQRAFARFMEETEATLMVR
jgi:UDPglucose--hexose-1-phosphate uridylyltransferase